MHTSFVILDRGKHCCQAILRLASEREITVMPSAAVLATEPLPLSTTGAEVQAALAVAEDPSAAPEERAEMQRRRRARR